MEELEVMLQYSRVASSTSLALQALAEPDLKLRVALNKPIQLRLP